MKNMIRRLPVLLLCLVLTLGMLTFSAAAESESVEYLVRDEFGNTAPFDVSMLWTLDEQASMGVDNVTMDVRDLKYAELYEIVRCMGGAVQTEAVCAGIYVMDGAYYYLNYEQLGNQHFDADGNFSYRSGTVALTDAETYREGIETQLAPLLDPPFEEMYDDYSITGIGGADFSTVETVLLWVGCILLGLVAPLPFLIIGLVVSGSEKLGRPGYWRVLSYIALVWMAAAAAVMLLMLLV